LIMVVNVTAALGAYIFGRLHDMLGPKFTSHYFVRMDWYNYIGVAI